MTRSGRKFVIFDPPYDFSPSRGTCRILRLHLEIETEPERPICRATSIHSLSVSGRKEKLIACMVGEISASARKAISHKLETRLHVKPALSMPKTARLRVSSTTLSGHLGLCKGEAGRLRIRRETRAGTRQSGPCSALRISHANLEHERFYPNDFLRGGGETHIRHWNSHRSPVVKESISIHCLLM